MDIRRMLLNGRYGDAVRIHGKKTVCDELESMAYHDMADHALMAAHSLGYTDIARSIAPIVRNSGAYGTQANEIARKY